MERENHLEETLQEDLKEVAEETLRLEERLAQTEAELKALKDRYLRLLADFDNYRKRMAEELKAREEEGVLKALRALLPVLDDLERALEFAEAKPETILQGVRAVREGFYRILSTLGVEEVPGEGEAFDPRHHEAIGLLPGEAGKVAKVFQRGFRLGAHLVRPARVAVGQEKSPEEEGVE
ncbi:nucleotide exchange factor GrpE [Thermus oshimai]|jgi:molecular chaperone GrpE|uniref:Protein GrpE n=1 Tax=Thermus oshimai JL-2 TaxID=751945 RepID=K7QYL3_THEOS|nr:nucleotide exchange factor GrpE [Thermus oshimai]AFV75745.1 molecular chaperone GrpE (heat shock protein) [Thermus oshimai JL-2]